MKKENKITEAIKITGNNLSEILELECVDCYAECDGGRFAVFLSPKYTAGRIIANSGDYICKFSNGMWQVFGQEAYMNELKK
jgi:hypothetical protein